ncbi:MAG: hypothetical protein Q7J12_07255, partial [Syntrophales bacterium]|nr:hypothetical protein [Syntrophales bacterium]
FKKKNYEYEMKVLKEYTSNIDEDKIIGVHSHNPDDVAMFNPSMTWGGWSVKSWVPPWGSTMQPVSEWTGHKIRPIENLYGVGAGWQGGFGSAGHGYAGYKAIALDLGLRKPWEEKGRPY